MKTEKYIYPSTLLCDFYKISHRVQYPKGTEKIFATWTPRTSRIEGVKEVVAFGFQAFIKEYLIDYFNENFFNRPLEDIVHEYSRVIKYTLGDQNPDTTHIEQLHKLGYLPIKIKAVKEGTLIPIRVPMLTIENTQPQFFWLTNYLETLMSCMLWQPTTSATIAFEYRKILQQYAKETNGSVLDVPFQGHDFSMRGMGSLQTAKSSGAGHLLSFTGTDTIPAILYMEEFYNANLEKELIGASIPATEHSCMCSYGEQGEFDTYKHLIKEVYPKGLVSIVSDTWDLWSVITNIIPKLKDDIMARDGKVVIRPDSGNPVDIICGTAKVYDMDNNEYVKCFEDAKETMKELLTEKVREETPHGEYGDDNPSGLFKYKEKIYEMILDVCWNRYDKQFYFIDGVTISSCEEEELTAEEKGVIELLWEIFGGTITEKGYKQLDSHIGAIYGDAITIYRCKEICERLKEKGFASTNMVYGIGSFTYQYNTRDTFGFALKSTYAIVNGEERKLFKDPKTDKGSVKKSQKGLVAVVREDEKIKYIDDLLLESKEALKDEDLLEDVFMDGKLLRDDSLTEIRKRVLDSI